MAEPRQISVLLVYSPAPRVVHELILNVPSGTRLSDARALAAQDPRFAHLPSEASFGVWGRKVTIHHSLRHEERLEIYRPLRVDPKVARRERFKKQGAKSAGLFAKRRPGAKAGY
ncbi:RnfH family protein [Variovorax sp. PCZ-1]|uniref:RnfH family protein n=1 Tax=Variovorax sp. PCZ-1 TaxID=2835533 RepID=UPI001BCDA870|nr:RnfH family protein [Variovorax sp. PCZ-1]MBS7806445.1 RnfH family protein [Variovorax sp. PCZ-1]